VHVHERTPLISPTDCNLALNQGFRGKQVDHQIEASAAGKAIDGSIAKYGRREFRLLQGLLYGVSRYFTACV
jgi:hypothetical protein